MMMNWQALPYDYKLLRGDPMLILSLSVPIILWALMQFIFPWISIQTLELWNIDISPWYRQTGSFFLLLIPMMFGMVYGFILLDERDGGVITAISVTPVGKSGKLVQIPGSVKCECPVSIQDNPICQQV